MSVIIDVRRGLSGASLLRSTPPLRVERVPADKLHAITGQWADLCGRAMEPNVFLEPSFALPLMSRVSPGRRTGAVLVWEDSETSRLLALLPVAAPTLLSPGVVRAFHDEQAALGTPLLDHERGAEAFAAILVDLARRWSRAHSLILTRLPADGAVGSMLWSRATQPAILGREERVVLSRPVNTSGNSTLIASAEGRMKQRQQCRHVADLGSLAFGSASSPEAVADALERFLSLEGDSGKGARGTALLSNPVRASFARAALRRMAENGMCRIDTLSFDGKAIAMGIVLTARGRAHVWKTAYDERFSALSPEVQFAADLMRRQLGDPEVSLTDSCAVAGQSMIARAWIGRMPLVDVAIELRPKPYGVFRRAVELFKSGRRRGGTPFDSVEKRRYAPISD